MSRCRMVILFLILCTATRLFAYGDHRNRHVDSLEHVLNTCPPADKEALLHIYDNLAWGYLEINEEKSTHYCQKGIALAKELKGYLMLVNLNRVIGMHHWGHTRYDEARESFERSLEYVDKMVESGKYTKKDIDDQRSALYGSLGNLYNTLGQGAKALDYYHKALRIFNEYGWQESETIAYSNMAELFYCMGNMEHAQEYHLKVDSIARLTQDSLFIALAQQGLAKVAMKQKDYVTAWQLIDKVYDYLFAHPDEEGSSRSECLIVMTDIADEEGDWAKAEKLIRQSEELAKELHQDLPSAVLWQKAKLATKDGNWKEAERLAMQAIKTDPDAQDVAQDTYRLLSDIYAHMGNADMARVYTLKADSVQTTWSNYAYQSSLREQETRFETEKKEMIIRNLAKQKRLWHWLTGAMVALAIVLMVVIVVVKHSHRKQKALLAARVALETEAKERNIIARDLHDGLGGMLSLAKLKMANEQPEEAIRLLDESIVEMRRLAHHIMPEELAKNGLVSSLRDFAISIPGAQFHYYGEPKRLSKEHELVLYRCAYELVNNAIKHAAAEHIDIQLMVDNEQAALTVSDNGKGFDASQQGKGMGLQSIRNRIAQYNGKMEIITSLEQGTEINVTLPL